MRVIGTIPIDLSLQEVHRIFIGELDKIIGNRYIRLNQIVEIEQSHHNGDYYDGDVVGSVDDAAFAKFVYAYKLRELLK